MSFSPQKPPTLDNKKNENVSGRLVELLSSKQQPEEMRKALHSSPDHEEEIHLDERWLIAYADKMTILCGFFIMLFAISTLDPVKLQKVTKSAEKSFGRPDSNIPNQAFIDPTVVEKLKVETQIQIQQIQMLEVQKKELEQVVAKQSKDDAKKENLVLKIDQLSKEKMETENKLKVMSEQIKKMDISQQKQVQLTTQINELERKNETLQRQIKVQDNNPKVSPEQLISLKIEKDELKSKLNILQRELTQKKEETIELSKELQISKANAMGSGFAAFVMSWPTRDHDIDLVVKDPQGNTFDFKRRSYTSLPGLLVLDTRQGPGVEVWQSDRVISGIYTFNYLFYNAYGNMEPCPITGTLFTSKGRIELPKINLNIHKNKSANFRISIDENGKARLLP